MDVASERLKISATAGASSERIFATIMICCMFHPTHRKRFRAVLMSSWATRKSRPWRTIHTLRPSEPPHIHRRYRPRASPDPPKEVQPTAHPVTPSAPLGEGGLIQSRKLGL